MQFCETCNEWSFGPGHKCPPIWNVWPEGNEFGFDNRASYEIRADSAENAAIQFGHRMCDDGPERWTVFVRASDDERPQAQKFELDYYMQPVFSARALGETVAK